jgi:hypothetical protein
MFKRLLSNWYSVLDSLNMVPVEKIKLYCQNSSIKCLPKLMQSRTKIQTFVWGMSLIIGLTVATYELYNLFSAFTSHRTSLSVSRRQGKSAQISWFSNPTLS